MWGGVGVVLSAFVCAGWVVCRVFIAFAALSRPLLGFRRPSCLLTLLCWRRPWAVLFSMPGWRWRVGPSVRLFLHTFLLLRGVSNCMFPAALHTLLCLRRLVCVCIVWAYLSLSVMVVLFSLVWCWVACNILVLVSPHGCPWWWCVWLPPCLFLALLAAAYVCACAGGIPFAPYVSGRAGVGMFSRLSVMVLFVLFSFAFCVVARHVTYLFSAEGGVVVACLFFEFLFSGWYYFPLVMCGSLRAFFVSFFHPSPSWPFIPCNFSAVMMALLYLW